MIKKEKIICHVCGKIKKSYTIFMNNDIFSLIKHYQAREKGEICERFFSRNQQRKNGLSVLCPLPCSSRRDL